MHDKTPHQHANSEFSTKDLYAPTPAHIADMALLARVRQGDQAAMAEIFDRHGKAVYSVALHVLKDDGYAEDVMQEIFVRVWQHSDLFAHTRGSLRAWLVTLTRNRSIDVLRRRKPSDPVEQVFLASGCNPATEAEQHALIERVQKALNDLPQEQQECMHLAFFEGLTHAEIAQKTGEPLGTIKTRIRLALIRLRRLCRQANLHPQPSQSYSKTAQVPRLVNKP